MLSSGNISISIDEFQHNNIIDITDLENFIETSIFNYLSQKCNIKNDSLCVTAYSDLITDDEDVDSSESPEEE